MHTQTQPTPFFFSLRSSFVWRRNLYMYQVIILIIPAFNFFRGAIAVTFYRLQPFFLLRPSFFSHHPFLIKGWTKDEILSDKCFCCCFFFSWLLPDLQPLADTACAEYDCIWMSHFADRRLEKSCARHSGVRDLSRPDAPHFINDEIRSVLFRPMLCEKVGKEKRKKKDWSWRNN